MRAFLDSDAGRTFLSHDWKWFPVIVVLVLFNTLLAEELFFCGLLLPRMRRVFGRRDWAANAFLFAVFHPHMPCAMQSTLLVDTLALSYPWRRYYSAPIGIIVHTSQSIFVLALPLTVVLRKGDGTDRT